MLNEYAVQWQTLLNMSKERPYVFRTRLERLLLKTIKYATCTADNGLKELCISMKNKLSYLSDQSNHTSDGTLRSYIVLKDDMEAIYQMIA